MLLSALVYFALLVGNLQAQFPPNVVDTNYGKVDGLITDQAKVFRGIPYARPPVKELRWQDPLPPFPWPGILQVTEDPPACPQVQGTVIITRFFYWDRKESGDLFGTGLLFKASHTDAYRVHTSIVEARKAIKLPPTTQINTDWNRNCSFPKAACPTKIQEDCLYLNVFTPLTATTSSKLPVMVFIHGGGFTSGYGGGLIYDGQYIVNHTNIILVTINYRLGALGFLVYGNNLEIGGNYGLKDQRFALKWVQENIAYFGGDPSSVTIFGQSAGGVSVASHMSSVESSGLFHKAIIESNPMGVSLKGILDSIDLGHRFASQIGCGDNDVDCIRGKDVDSIVAAELAVEKDIVDYYHLFDIFMQWTPYMDGIEISDQPIKAFKEGRIASVPVIMGNVGEEAYSYTMGTFVKPITTEFDYAMLQVAFYGIENYQEVAQQYPYTEGIDNRNKVSTMGTDNPFWCPTRYAAGGFANSTGYPVWVYNFDHLASFDPWPAWQKYCASHVCHGEELAFLFHTAPLGGYKYNADEEKLSNQMITYWTNLAKYGDPNGESDMSWPRYTHQTKNVLRFLTPENKVEEYRSDYCDFWDQIGYNV